MILKELIQRQGIQENAKLKAAYSQFENLLIELRAKEMSDPINSFINTQIDGLNSISDSGKALKKQVCKKQAAIITHLEKELKVVPKNHYRNTWMVLGLATFGLPLGVVFGAIMENMGLLGLGLPLGMVIGMAMGAKMDKKALEEGRQLEIELK